jgi:hypothetical protein
MKALVVYESLYGNTAAIGEAIASALRTDGLEAAARPVTEVSATGTSEVDLLVVGGPTHAHGMSRPATRKVGATDKKNTFPEPTVTPGLREWLVNLPPGEGRLAAAFDTRFDHPSLMTGSAAKGIARRLKANGFHMIAEPKSFFVTPDTRLADEEIDHAATWAGALAERASEPIGR